MLLLIEHEVSVDEKPEPEITTVIPVLPDEGVKVMVGVVRRNVPEILPGLFPPLPVTVIVWGPGLLLTRTKVPVNDGLVVMVHDGVP